MKQLLVVCVLAVSVLVASAAPVWADDSEPGSEAGDLVLASHGLLSQLERFLHHRELDTTSLTAESMVGVMINWARFEPATGIAGTDALIYQYGGWSEGCATGFKFSLLRKVSLPESAEGSFAQTAGITLIFEPSANADLAPFKLVSSELNSIDAFMAAIEGSPAFKKLASTTPMSVVVESGGMR